MVTTHAELIKAIQMQLSSRARGAHWARQEAAFDRPRGFAAFLEEKLRNWKPAESERRVQS